MFAQAKLSLQTGAIDVAEPTVDRIGGWASNGLTQGWDVSKLSIDNYLPGLADGKMGEMATVDGKRMIVLSVWGTEAIVYSKTDAPTEYGNGEPRRSVRSEVPGQGLPAPAFGAGRDGPLPRQRR